MSQVYGYAASIYLQRGWRSPLLLPVRKKKDPEAGYTGYKGIDPEANGYGNTNIGLGIDRIRPYLPRTYTMGINLGL